MRKRTHPSLWPFSDGRSAALAALAGMSATVLLASLTQAMDFGYPALISGAISIVLLFSV